MLCQVEGMGFVFRLLTFNKLHFSLYLHYKTTFFKACFDLQMPKDIVSGTLSGPHK